MTHEAQMTDLREKVARYLCEVQGTDPNRIINVENPKESGPKVGWHFYTDEADAVLSIARPAIIEECAKVAETYQDREPLSILDCQHTNIAADIRALAEKP